MNHSMDVSSASEDSSESPDLAASAASAASPALPRASDSPVQADMDSDDEKRLVAEQVAERGRLERMKKSLTTYRASGAGGGRSPLTLKSPQHKRTRSAATRSSPYARSVTGPDDLMAVIGFTSTPPDDEQEGEDADEQLEAAASSASAFRSIEGDRGSGRAGDLTLLLREEARLGEWESRLKRSEALLQARESACGHAEARQTAALTLRSRVEEHERGLVEREAAFAARLSMLEGEVGRAVASERDRLRLLIDHVEARIEEACGEERRRLAARMEEVDRLSEALGSALPVAQARVDAAQRALDERERFLAAREAQSRQDISQQLQALVEKENRLVALMSVAREQGLGMHRVASAPPAVQPEELMRSVSSVHLYDAQPYTFTSVARSPPQPGSSGLQRVGSTTISPPQAGVPLHRALSSGIMMSPLMYPSSSASTPPQHRGSESTLLPPPVAVSVPAPTAATASAGPPGTSMTSRATTSTTPSSTARTVDGMDAFTSLRNLLSVDPATDSLLRRTAARHSPRTSSGGGYSLPMLSPTVYGDRPWDAQV